MPTEQALRDVTEGVGEGLSLRPLAEESMQGKQAFISGAYRVVELGAPGHAGEDAEEVLQLCGREGTVLVLSEQTGVSSRGRTRPTRTHGSPQPPQTLPGCREGPWHAEATLPAAAGCHGDAFSGRNQP